MKAFKIKIIDYPFLTPENEICSLIHELNEAIELDDQWLIRENSQLLINKLRNHNSHWSPLYLKIVKIHLTYRRDISSFAGWLYYLKEWLKLKLFR